MKPVYYPPSDILKEQSKYTPPESPNIPVVYLTRNFLGRVVQVLTIPTLIYDAPYPQNIMLTNPAPIPGGLVTGTGLATQQVGVVALGNSQLTPVFLSNYLNMHLFLNITAIAAGTTWSFFNQILDPVTGLWVDSQALIAGVTPAIVGAWTNASFYAFIGQFGVGLQYALRWTLDGGAGAISFTVSYALKEGLFGSSGGLSLVIYLGSNSGV